MNFLSHLLFLLFIAAIPKTDPIPQWLVGYWAMTFTDTGKPESFTVEFTEEGSFIAYSPSCQPLSSAHFKYRKGIIYIERTKPNNEIRTELLTPNTDHTQLIAISKTTGHRGVFVKAKTCIKSQS